MVHQKSIAIYDPEDLHQFHVLNTGDNPMGLCAMSTAGETEAIIAVPAANNSGTTL